MRQKGAWVGVGILGVLLFLGALRLLSEAPDELAASPPPAPSLRPSASPLVPAPAPPPPSAAPRKPSPASSAAAAPTESASRVAAKPGLAGPALPETPAPTKPLAASGLQGRVVDGAGKGIPKASVVLKALNEQIVQGIPAGMRSTWLAQMELQGPAAIAGMLQDAATVTTDAEGRFRIEAEVSSKDHRWLYVDHEGSVRVMSKAFRDYPSGVEVQLVQGGRVTVEVFKPDGTPAEGAFVNLTPDASAAEAPVSRGLKFVYLGADLDPTFAGGFSKSGGMVVEELALAGEAEGEAETEGEADTEGEAPPAVDPPSLEVQPLGAGSSSKRTFEDVPPGKVTITASASGLRSQVEELVVLPGQNHTVRLTLATGLSITGRVVTQEGKPIVNAQVHAYTAKGMSHVAHPPTTTSGADGSFTLTGLDDADYQLNAWAENYQQQGVGATVRPGGEPVVLKLSRTFSISGKVTAAEDGNLSGILVFAGQAAFGSSSQAITGEDGRFVLQGLQPGAFTLRAKGPTRASLDPVRVVVRNADVEGVELPIRKGATLTVRVTEGGRPVKDANVTARSGQDARAMMSSLGTGENQATNEEGATLVQGLAPGEYEVEVRKEGYAPAKRVVRVDEGEEAKRVEIQIEAGATLRCRVLKADGSPYGQTMIFVIPQGADFTSPFVFQDQVMTDQEGRFEKTGLAPGRYRIQGMMMQVELGGGGMQLLGEVTVERGQASDVELRIAPSTCVVKGHVVKAGKPAASTRVMVYRDGDVMAGFTQSLTDAEGRFEAKSLTPGVYAVAVEGAPKQVVTLREGATQEVALEIKAGVVAGSLRNALGQPAPGVTVLITSLEGKHEEAFRPPVTTDATGTFRLEQVTPGRYRVSARAPGLGATAGIEVTLNEYEALTGLELQLGAGGTVELEVLRADGKPAAGARVTLYNLDQKSFAANANNAWATEFAPRTTRLGTAKVETLIPGRYVAFVATTSHEHGVVTDLDVREGGALSRRVQLSPGADVEVLAPAGSAVQIVLPATGAPLDASQSPWAQAFGLSRTNSEGILTLKDLPAIEVEVRATSPDGRALGPWRGRLVAGTPNRVVLR